MWEEAQIPLSEETPYYSVYSRRDGILDWRACLDPAAELVQVSTSHCGMALDPAVFEVVTDALAEIGARRLRQEIRVVAG
jgi:hypothetical protein